MPRLRTRLHFDEADVQSVRRVHEELDRTLREQGLGHVEMLYEDTEAAVREQLFGGYHQAGTARMSDAPEDGVLDRNLAVHGFDDLFVAGGAAFPTSSQANTTFEIVAFAVRLADHLSAQLRDGGEASERGPGHQHEEEGDALEQVAAHQPPRLLR
jgi:choline dehydrogenase-like flavoprotein